MIHDQKSLEENAFNLRSRPKIRHLLKLSPLNTWSILYVFACWIQYNKKKVWKKMTLYWTNKEVTVKKSATVNLIH